MNTLHATDLLEYVIDAVVVTDITYKILFWNKASESLYGYTASEVKGRSVYEVLNLSYKHTTREDALQEFKMKGQWRGEVLSHDKSGKAIPILASIALVTNKENKPIGVISVNRDISDRVSSEEALTRLNQQLKRSAYYDHLTNLPNRRYLERLFEKHILVNRQKQPWFLVCLDLNGFKRVNDSYGHDVGDQLLIKVAKLLKLGIREGDYVARFGGDEFVFLLRAKTKTDVLIMLYRLAYILEQPIYLNSLSLKVTASMGLAQMSPADKTFESLFRKADQAMYKAKAAKETIISYADMMRLISAPSYLRHKPSQIDDT